MYNAYPFSRIRIIEISTSIFKTLHYLIITYNNHVMHVLKINRVVRQCFFSTVDSFDTGPKFMTMTMTDIGTWSTVDSHCQCLKCLV